MRVFKVFLFFLCSHLVQAQIVDHLSLEPDTADRYRFEMRDGSIVYGVITHSDQLSLTVETLQLGGVIMQKGSIREVRKIDMTQFHYFAKWSRHPIAHEYFVTPSAHMLQKGTAQYRTLMLLYHAADVGITDHFSTGGGFMWFSPLSSNETPSLFVRARTGTRIARNLNIAGTGMLIGSFPSRNFFDTRSPREIDGVLQGVATYGTTDTHVSIGGGHLFRSTERASTAFFTMAATARLTRVFSLLTENWIIAYERQHLLSFGLRLHGTNVSFDLAAAVEVSDPQHMTPRPFAALAVLL